MPCSSTASKCIQVSGGPVAIITSTRDSNPDLPEPRPVALPPGHSVGSLVIKVCFVRQGSEALLRGGKWVVTRLVTPAHRDDGYCSSESTPRGLKTGKSISTVYRFYYICYIVIPIIHHGKKLNYTRLEPQLVEVLGCSSGCTESISSASGTM